MVGCVDVFVGTTDGVFRLGDGSLARMDLASLDVTALYADGEVVLAGTYGDGLFRRGGDEWERVADGTFRFVTPELAGTEPARVLHSGDGGRTWEELPGIAEIPGHEQWFLPYSPRAGASRNVYASGDRLLVAGEVAGLLRSDDGGRSWVCEPVDGDEDIHQVTGHPDDPDLLFVSLGTAALHERGEHGGIARSRDGGRTWERVETDYTRSAIVPPARPDLLVAGPARRVGRLGRIVVSADGGDSWEPAGDGIELPMPDMVELFVPSPDGSVWAVCSGGRLLRAEPGEWRWASPLPVGSEAVTVRSVAFA
jgi:photosystem II stability/assembly factor-like uncharacterized protein